ncbi:MAG: hypothetical protein U9Q23_02390 [Candidatus Bipolaricaulota bacterium]|nr:hypothetical protein [Candidatus Bipolaricaulota bacterium]
MNTELPQTLFSIYNLLLADYGKQGWWPSPGPFETIVGAILTQGVTWKNVEPAISALNEAGLMQPQVLARTTHEKIAALIRPCGYYNEKTKRLKAFLHFLAKHHHNDLAHLFNLPIADLRHQLLSVSGIGEETADTIILYAALKPSFVIDTYTKRIFNRLGLLEPSASYSQAQSLFMDNLPLDVGLYNEYHALIVQHGKRRCRSLPNCDGCPLKRLCQFTSWGQT